MPGEEEEADGEAEAKGLSLPEADWDALVIEETIASDFRFPPSSSLRIHFGCYPTFFLSTSLL